MSLSPVVELPAAMRKEQYGSGSNTPSLHGRRRASASSRDLPKYREVYRETPQMHAKRINQDNLKLSAHARRQLYGSLIRQVYQRGNSASGKGSKELQEARKLQQAVQNACNDSQNNLEEDEEILQPNMSVQNSPFKQLLQKENKPRWNKMCIHPNKDYKPPVNQENYISRVQAQNQQLHKVAFHTSEFYRYDADKFRYKNANRGHDKVSLFKKYNNGWTDDAFIHHNHKLGYATNESREGRKLDISGHMAKNRSFPMAVKTGKVKCYSPRRDVQPRASQGFLVPGMVASQPTSIEPPMVQSNSDELIDYAASLVN